MLKEIPESVNHQFDSTPFSINKAKKNLDPVLLFEEWLQYALSKNISDANAMALATVNHEKQPSCRMVLLKQYWGNQFYFYTNYNSQKAQDLERNPQASLLFFWNTLQRQIRIEGEITKISKEQSQIYFHSRYRGSQIGALVSQNQSKPVASRNVLEKREQILIKQYTNKKIPLPSFWGGYKLTANKFEFWKGRKNRIHDRLSFCLEDANSNRTSTKLTWSCERLEP